jgi:hypothetical protein
LRARSGDERHEGWGINVKQIRTTVKNLNKASWPSPCDGNQWAKFFSAKTTTIIATWHCRRTAPTARRRNRTPSSGVKAMIGLQVISASVAPAARSVQMRYENNLAGGAGSSKA